SYTRCTFSGNAQPSLTTFKPALELCCLRAVRPADLGATLLKNHCDGRTALNRNPFNFIKGDLVTGAVVELSRAGRLVGGDGLGVLNGSAVLQVRRDTSGAEGMAAS